MLLRWRVVERVAERVAGVVKSWAVVRAREMAV
jgi:hypothetical protein